MRLAHADALFKLGKAEEASELYMRAKRHRTAVEMWAMRDNW